MLTWALTFLSLTLFLSTLSVAAPTPQPWYEKYHQPRVAVPQTYYEAVSLRRQTPITRNVVQDVVCLDSSVNFIEYDEHAAMLGICGGIAGSSVGSCRGSPATTTGRSGKAQFTARATQKGATISISKDSWAACVGAARQACPKGSFRGVCLGGATRGDVAFELTSV
ncbi:uncharacterized protein B0T15DRAFT_41644 [Chaetomium strumarium]|uniref:Uncharacterized protein n=1 Tax=Chaetomium strumarium TaxID=1170767 RepID=A0AAJ0M661_9PEZI|nr:hypothetical protein B0T15DRAFT_41644 [Chaetomium strumarium]